MQNHSGIFKGFVLTVLTVCFSVTAAFAQGRIEHSVEVKEKQPGPAMGRDLWFTMARNYESQGGKYYQLYVTSPNATTINIQVTGGTTFKKAIQPLEVLPFIIPLGWEVTSSGIVEDLAIRVWSNDADLTAYMLSRNPATSDGMYIIPTIGWGTEYVVAGYHSLYEGFGTTFDYPSEFSIVANQDNTICSVIPSADIRKNGLKNEVLHKKGSAFTETLDRGQCVQYMLTEAQNADDYDVTGSIVRSNKPVGIVGASQCPNIPPEYTYCDHICDMIPPVRTWAKTYYTLPFYNRKGGDSFVMIGSKNGQTIYFNGNVVTSLQFKFDYLFRPDIADAGTWTSDAPFMLAQYINSTDWPDPVTGQTNAGIGDPAMVVINSREQYSKEIVFQTPTITQGTGYTHYSNVVVHKDAVINTTMDGIPIGSFPSTSPLPIPYSDYIAYRTRSLKPGTHHIKSSDGVGVYVYGYGSYDSYAWAGALGTRTFDDPDTVAPVVNPAGVCFDARVDLRDNHLNPVASKILDIVLDSINNMRFTPDPAFVSGGGMELAFYDMSVIDPNKDAYLRVTTIDGAGNRSMVTSVYQPMTAVIDPPVHNYGKGVTGSPILKDFIITNTGAVPFKIQKLYLAFNTKGFKLVNPDLSDIAVGGTRPITVSFEPVVTETVDDTLIVEDGCNRITAEMLGNGGKPDFTVAGYEMKCELVGGTYTRNLAVIRNPSDQPLTIEDIWVDDVVHFGYNKNTPASNQLPFTLGPGEERKLETTFMPNTVGAFTTILHVKSTNVGEKTTLLKDCGIAPGAKTEKDQIQVAQCATDPVQFIFTTTATGSAPTTISKFVVTGHPGFQQPTQFTNLAGTSVSLPIQLQGGESVNAVVDFIPPPQASGTYTAQIYAISSDGDTTNTVSATVREYFRAAQMTKPSATIPVVLFGSPAVTEFVTICNSADDSLAVENIIHTGTHRNSFNIVGYRKNGNIIGALPDTLAKGECLDILIEFDPTKSTDAVQTSDFNIFTNACQSVTTATIQGGTRLGPPSIQGFSEPAIFSCNTTTNVVPITNPGLAGANITVKNVTVTGPDQAFFTIVGATPTLITGGTSENVTVQFNPALAIPGRTYTAQIEALITKTDGVDSTMVANIDATANGMSAQVSSTFAVADQSVKVGNNVRLPIALAVNKNGLPLGFDVVDVRRIVLVYKYNSDILDIINDDVIANFIRGTSLPTDWTIDPSSNLVEGTGGVDGTLTLVLTGATPLPDGVTSLGEMAFSTALSKYGKSTNVTLESATFYRADQTPIQGCFNVTTVGTSTELVYACGDQTLIDALNGQAPSTIAPASPNPVTNRSDLVTLRYAVRYMSTVTLSIYDELGKEVKRLVETRQHPAGAYEVKFDPSALASGTYTYRLVMDNASRSGRFVVNY